MCTKGIKVPPFCLPPFHEKTYPALLEASKNKSCTISITVHSRIIGSIQAVTVMNVVNGAWNAPFKVSRKIFRTSSSHKMRCRRDVHHGAKISPARNIGAAVVRHRSPRRVRFTHHFDFRPSPHQRFIPGSCRREGCEWCMECTLPGYQLAATQVVKC